MNNHYQRSFAHCHEQTYPGKPLKLVSGRLPTPLTGVYLRNGPCGSERKNMFEGQGFLQKLTFMNGQVVYQAKKVCNTGHNLNTNVVCWNGQVLALAESGPPYLIDPLTLEVIGRCAEHSIGAHPKVDESRRRLVTASLAYDFTNVWEGASTVVSFAEYEENNDLGGIGSLAHEHRVRLPGFVYFHDFSVTEHYYIFFNHKLAFNPVSAFMLGPEWGVSQQSTCTDIVMVCRKTGEMSVIDTGVSGFAFHHIFAKEEDGGVVIEYINYPQFFIVPTEANKGCIVRTRVDNGRKTCSTISKNKAWLEFPVSTGDGMVYAIMAGGSGIVKYDPDTNSLACYKRPGWIFSEPFVLGDCLISTAFGYEQEQSELILLDRHHLNEEPVAVLRFPDGPVSLGYHGTIANNEHMPFGNDRRSFDKTIKQPSKKFVRV